MHIFMKSFLAGAAVVTLTACQPAAPVVTEAPLAEPVTPVVTEQTLSLYAAQQDGDLTVPAIPPTLLTEDKARQVVDYWTDHPVGSIVVDPYARRLYHIQTGNKAMRYTVGVGAAGFGFAGEAYTPYQRDWPRWTPTDNMLATNPEQYAPSANGVEGGLQNPLGARALYIHNQNGDTFYRIHGTPDPQSIGTASSAGCIRLFNQDIIHLAERTNSMAKIIVPTQAQTGQGTIPPEVGGIPEIAAGATPASYGVANISSGD
ncbi:MAG: L,D-transpeptidase [Paracoccus sp.]|nr:L,D-transpeptidase [Paracoccus sp. (in: a-proteobacteria)]